MTEPRAGEGWTLTDPKGTELVVRLGLAFRSGDVAVSLYHDEDGATAYLTPDEARKMAQALIERAEEAERG